MIREATQDDIPNLLPLVKSFVEEIGEGELIKRYDIREVARVLKKSIDEGILLTTDEYNCIVAGLPSPVLWNPNYNTLEEIIFYVSPEAREGLLGGRLLKEYVKRVDSFENIFASTLCLMHNSPDLSKHYNKRGFNKIEERFIRYGG